jgi:hypothetical protein
VSSKKTQTATGLVAFAVAGLALASRYLPITNHVVLLTAALSPYLMLCGPLSVVLLILARRWILAVIAVGLTIAMLAVQLPLYCGSDAARTAGVGRRVIRLLTSCQCCCGPPRSPASCRMPARSRGWPSSTRASGK